MQVASARYESCHYKGIEVEILVALDLSAYPGNLFVQGQYIHPGRGKRTDN